MSGSSDGVTGRPCGHRWDIPLAEAAALYARLGYQVLPLEPGTKKPHRMLGETGGVHHASTDQARIAAWWRDGPAAGVGVACGSRSRLAVIDLDTKHADGPAAFRDFLSAHGLAIGWEGTARTPSGGWHAWLRMPSARERRGILPGVDIKGDGGYVVAAPSALWLGDGAGGKVAVPYAWQGRCCACCAPRAPAWLGPWIASAPAAGGGGGLDGTAVPDEGDDERGYAPGTRNISFYLRACSLYARGMSERAVLRRLAAIWDRTPQEGMTWAEVRRAADSARAFIEADRADETTRNGMMTAWLRQHSA